LDIITTHPRRATLQPSETRDKNKVPQAGRRKEEGRDGAGGSSGRMSYNFNLMGKIKTKYPL